MSSGAVMMAISLLAIFGVVAYLIGTTIKSIQNEKHTSMRLWKNFGLSLGFCILFFGSWAAQGIAEWQEYTDDQRDHKEATEIGDFTTRFARSTLENWQSEFLQLFSFTVMAAVLIHKGSAESRDSDDRISMALKRIEDHLGTEPTIRTDPIRQSEHLHVVPDSFEGWMLKGEDAEEPEGYYATQEEAIGAGRQLAKEKNCNLVIHSQDMTVRDSGT